MSFLSVGAYAQITDLNVSVRELTRQQPIAGQAVYRTNSSIGISLTATTGTNGQTQFRGLPLNGVYRVFASENTNYLESSSEDIVLRANAR